MTRDEEVRERTVKRFLECEAKRAEARAAALADGKSGDEAREIAHEAAKAHWNAWADDMLGRRKALEKSGVWSATKNYLGSIEPKNTETRAWLEEADASFSRCLFLPKGSEGIQEAPGDDKQAVEAWSLPVKTIAIEGRVADFRDFIFPAYAGFDSAAFSGGASFERATFSGDAGFFGATFSGDASFPSATFSGDVKFYGATFSGSAWFTSATFSGSASFSGASFSGDAGFFGATFSGDASFPSATFSGSAGFDHATFSGGASFDNATFSSTAWFFNATFWGDASFDRAAFSGITSFDHATFSGGVSFESATFSKSTSLRHSRFGSEEKKTRADLTAIKVDRAFDLSGASFSTVPSFCQADFKQAPDLDGVHFPLPPAEPLTSGDKDLIPKFRAIRRMAIQSADYDREQMAFKGEMRSRRWSVDKFWHPEGFFGWCYDWAADCGRSILRPFAIWLLSVFVFAVFYLPAGKNALDRCVSGDGSIFVRSLYLSGRNALVLSSGGKDDRITKAYQCLFDGSIPDGVSFVESFVQVPLSAVLIFLFLLAVKNRFKIK